ncbi:hypothetical protein Pla163_23510 [Planctomycetes bacterium Pla163]|uniref:Uncharacterized protein n=1 Tax=Rohdeia mirabilis TaxID=2528008 RepID=A0A518D160_9BACT|nr:hypothetical protein Pla163_23510 [Planctomycetes bacterium Pla163]
MRVSVYAWVFRHRHGLRSIYGLPPEPRIAGLLAASRAPVAPSRGREERRPAARRPEPALEAEGTGAQGSDRVRQLTIRPLPRRT